MTLFDIKIDTTKNLLSKGGTVNYYGEILNQTEANHYFNVLLSGIEWRNDETIIFGKKIITKRKVAWLWRITKPRVNLTFRTIEENKSNG